MNTNFCMEYVVSACSMFGYMLQNNKCIELAVPKLTEGTHHKFSMLYNAYTETKHAKILKEKYGNSIFNIHADSGGLQIVILGKSNTPEIRDGVYLNQSEFAQVGMCFDEIPLDNDRMDKMAKVTHAAKTLRTKDMFEFGKNTGLNIKRQLEVFEQQKSECLPQLIIQGNAPEDFKNFYEGAKEALGSDIEKLRGCALADTCIGTSVLDACDMLSMMQHLNLPDNLRKNVHLLGVGSIKRMLPALIMSQSGFLDKDIHISYDSSRHSNAPIFGNAPHQHSESFGQYGIGQHDNPKMRKSAKDIWNVFHEAISVIFEDESDWVETYVKAYSGTFTNAKDITHLEDGPEKTRLTERLNLTKMLLTFINIKTFIGHAERVLENPERACHLYGMKALAGLNKVTDYESYLRWRKTAYSSLNDNNRIKRDVDIVKKTDLCGFFG